MSVCVIAYNHEKYIAQTIDGFLAQKKDFSIEVIIGEDCSTDKTRQICLDYQKNFPDIIRVLPRTRNIGAHENFLDVMENCRGKYVAICEGDDHWTDTLKLQRQVDFLEANPDFALCFHNVLIEYETDAQQPHLLHTNELPDVLTFEDLAKENFIPTLSCVFRNRLFQAFPAWYREMPLGDWTLHLLNAEHGKIKYFSEAMGIYRVHDAGAWGNQAIEKRLLKVVAVIEKCREHFYPRGNEEFTLALKKTHRQICTALFSAFENGDDEKVRLYYPSIAKAAARLSPRTFAALTFRYLLSFSPSLAAFYRRNKE